MKEFVLLFRMDITNEDAQPDNEKMKIYMERWMHWINHISEKGQLANGGTHFSKSGRVLNPKNKILEGPYVYDNVSVAGYIIIRATNLTGATKIAEKCPILEGENTSVEIREVASAGE